MEKQILGKNLIADFPVYRVDGKKTFDPSDVPPKEDPGNPGSDTPGNNQDTPPTDGLSPEQLDSVLDYVTERSRKGTGFMLGKLWVSTETLLLALNLLVAVIGVIVVASKRR